MDFLGFFNQYPINILSLPNRVFLFYLFFKFLVLMVLNARKITPGERWSENHPIS